MTQQLSRISGRMSGLMDQGEVSWKQRLMSAKAWLHCSFRHKWEQME